MRRNKTPWYDNTPVRLHFERGARQVCPGLDAPRPGRSGEEIVYRAAIHIPYYNTHRAVTIRFARTRAILTPVITVDGPNGSPHRYRDGSLCVWEPTDPAEERWVSQDGLAELLRMIGDHLFKEEWWGETGEWLGPQVLHIAGKKTPDA